MITTQNDFDNETAWERTVLSLAVPMMPLTASVAGLDLRTNDSTIGPPPPIVNNDAVEELRTSLLPLLFGAAWKTLDIALELAFAMAGLAPQNSSRWTITEKSQLAIAHKGSLPGFASASDVWQALGALYKVTKEVRHALVHRRVQVDPSTRELIGFDTNGGSLPPLSYDEQMAFCRFAQRLGQAIVEGALRPRVEADLRKHLADLQQHHRINTLSHTSTKAPVRLISDFPANGRIDVPSLLSTARTTFPGTYYVDLELYLEDGRILTGELESAPQVMVTVTLAVPPDWLQFT